MGQTTHQALVVTGFDIDHVREAHGRANRTLEFGGLVTGFHAYDVNMGYSFAILPCGSKDGWPPAIAFNRELDDFIQWMREWNPYRVDLNEEHGNSLSWSRVEFEG